jgi:hypothetical protein
MKNIGTANCVMALEKKKEKLWLKTEIKLPSPISWAKYECINKTRILDMKDTNSFFFQKSDSFSLAILYTSIFYERIIAYF